MEKVIEFPEARVIEQEAAEWIVRLERSEKPSPQEIAELNQWIKRSPRHKRILIRYATLWSDMDVLSALMLFEPVRHGGMNAFKRWLMPIVSFAANLQRKFRSSRRSPAAVALMLLVVMVALSPVILDLIKNGQNQVLVTAVGEQLSRTLPDGSTLLLNTDSKVHVDYSPGTRRIVLERGEAFFKVTKDVQRPFEVYAGSRLVRALGTAFSVRRMNKSVKVMVTEGQVALAAVGIPVTAQPNRPVQDSGGSNAVSTDEKLDTVSQAASAAAEQGLGTLQMGQSVALSESEPGEVKAGDIVVYGKRELQRHLSWRDGVLVFAGEPLVEVVEEVGRYTSLQIHIVDPELQSMRIGGQFQVGETAALFDALETGFGLEVSYRDATHVEIRGSK